MIPVEKNCDKLITHTSVVSTSSGLKLSRYEKSVMISENPDLIGMILTQAKLVLIQKTVIIYFDPGRRGEIVKQAGF